MQTPRVSVLPPAGIAFELADLLLVRAWAEFHDLRMAIELDYCAGGEEYEEILEFYTRNSVFRRWMIWRDASGIVVQPMMGRPLRFDCVSDALEHLIPARA
jgi:hypothetical protein